MKLANPPRHSPLSHFYNADFTISILIRNSHARKIAQAIDDGALEGYGTVPTLQAS